MKLKNNKPTLQYLSSLKAALLLCPYNDKITINQLIDNNLFLIKDIQFNYDFDELISYSPNDLKTMGVAKTKLIDTSLELAMAQCGYNPSDDDLKDFCYEYIYDHDYDFGTLFDEYIRKRKFIYNHSSTEILKSVAESFDAYYISILSKIYLSIFNA